MCYPKPGPRCSTHALKKLLDAKAELNSTDPTDLEKINGAKRKLTLAQKEYFTSPAGIKKLREKAKATGDSKYAAMADEYAAKRKTQLAEYKKFVADKESVSTKSSRSSLEQDVAKEQAEREVNRNLDADQKRRKDYEKALYQHKEQLQYIADEFTALERFQVPESLYSTKIDAEYDYDYRRCGYDGVCSAYEGDYCRDSQYVNLRVDPQSIRTAKTLADIYGCDEAHIPEDLEKFGREELELDEPHSYDAEEVSGYYGAESADITLSNPHGVRMRLQDYYEEKHADITKRYEELKKNAPKPLTPASKDAKKKSPKPASKTAVARSKAPSKRGASKVAPASKPKVQRRERTAAELDAFERDAMPLPSSRARKALLNDPVKKAPTRPRKQWTEAEMDAFEADQRN